MFLALRTAVRAVGFERARTVGEALGELQFRLAFRERHRCTRDLTQLLERPQGDPETRSRLRQAYRVNTGAILQVMAMFEREVPAETVLRDCALEGEAHLHAALAQGRGAIVMAAHMGNALLVAVRLAQAGLPVSVVYRQARMMSEQWFGPGLARYGIEPILANQGIKAYARMLAAVRKNRIVFVLMDQGVGSAKDGVPVRFLGKDMPMPAGPAMLSRHAKAPVLPLATVGARPAWSFRLEPPVPRIADSSLDDDVRQLLAITERHVREHPELWTWQQRRWRHFPMADAGTAPPGA